MCLKAGFMDVMGSIKKLLRDESITAKVFVCTRTLLQCGKVDPHNLYIP